jgi:hypothetical protein
VRLQSWKGRAMSFSARYSLTGTAGVGILLTIGIPERHLTSGWRGLKAAPIGGVGVAVTASALNLPGGCRVVCKLDSAAVTLVRRKSVPVSNECMVVCTVKDNYEGVTAPTLAQSEASQVYILVIGATSIPQSALLYVPTRNPPSKDLSGLFCPSASKLTLPRPISPASFARQRCIERLA